MLYQTESLRVSLAHSTGLQSSFAHAVPSPSCLPSVSAPTNPPWNSRHPLELRLP